MKSILIFLAISCMIFSANAQVLKASVSIDYGTMPAEEINNLEDLTLNVEEYINNFAWTDDEYETDIEISIFIFVETVQKKSFEKIYKTQFQVKSVSGESFYDKEWEFPYQPGYLFDHSKIEFDPLCHFIDFYAYLVIGGELDGYGLNLGTPFYNEALNLANIGLMSKYSRGWNTRLKELQKITHIRTRPLREAKPDYFEAEYLFEEGNIKEAKIYAMKVLDAVDKVVNEQPNNKYLRTFFDAHHVFFAQIFEGDAKALTRLVRYDSYHKDIYRQAMP